MKKAKTEVKPLSITFRKGLKVLTQALENLPTKHKAFEEKKKQIEEEINSEGRKTKGFYIKLPIR